MLEIIYPLLKLLRLHEERRSWLLSNGRRHGSASYRALWKGENGALMPSSHCTILARFFTRRQVLINRRQMPEIGGKSVLVHANDNRAVWIIKDAIWGNRRCVADARQIFGMLNIWSCRRFTILLCEWVLTGSDWKIHRRWPTATERARYRAAGSSRRSFFFIFFF